MSILFVPMAIEAYMTNNENSKQKEIASIAPDYTKLKNKTQLGGKLEPRAFETSVPLEAGVHLHFILPDALTHAVTLEEGSLKYPRVPNRWLVTRLFTGSKIQSKSWIVESDYLGLDNKNSVTVPFLSDKDFPYRFIGRSYPTEESPAAGDTYLEELTAIGPGDSSFAAYYPSCRTVFGFHDKLEDVASGDLTYFVMGYYADEKNDPLYHLSEGEYNQYVTENCWSVSGPQAEKMICHGMVHTVPWRGVKAEYPSNTPTGEINIAIGNTSVEALSSLIANQLCDEKKDVLERFLTMMQYDLLHYSEGIDAVAEVENHIHAKEFEPEEGGSLWHIRLKGTDNDESGPKVRIPKGTGTQLTLLNKAQADYDGLCYALQSERQRLFSSWQRYVRRIEEPPAPWEKTTPSKEDIEKEIRRLCDTIDKLKSNIEDAEHDVKKAEKALEDIIAPVKDRIILEKAVREPFYHAKPPVLLFGGAGISRQYAYGEDGRFAKDGTLLCRTSLIEGLDGTDLCLEEKDILSYCDISENLPPEYKDLFCEVVCLSPDLLAEIEKKKGVQELNARGLAPSPIGYAPWRQPWISLFMEWSMIWSPTRTSIQPENSFNGWQFSDMDYEYSGNPPTPETSYTGRTILTPHSTLLLEYVFKKNIERYKSDEQLYKKLKETVEKTKDLAILSQQLSGLWTQFLSLEETLQLPIIEKDDDADVTREIIPRMEDALPMTLAFDIPFYPIRAGFLRVNNVNIVNSFGIRQRVASTLKKTFFSEELLHDIEGKGMFPPRFIQGARLNFDWISSDDPDIVSCIDPSTSPVCCFLYPDFLNHALSVYESNGLFKGRLKLVYRESLPEVRWGSAPGEASDFESVSFQCEHTRKFLKALLQYNDNKDPAFYGFMYVIEKKMAAICTYSDCQDIFALWSRPLVLARARLSLDILGEPAYSEKSEDFGKKQSYGYEKTEVPIFIGDSSCSRDGALGFFPDSEDPYKTMHCIYKTEKIPVATDYLNYDSGLCVSPARNSDTCFSLLMEAGSEAVFRSGILPSCKRSILPEHVEKVLSTLDFSFEVTPIITDMDTIRLPLFSKENTSWTWYRREQEAYSDAGPVSEPRNVFADTNPVYLEGFLKRREQEK
ncbi:hypothetical protein [Sediminispirochaeta bajacaliforniensis]|uniref:hypothetical protein n=1 Tax=Sediminispirochaeta bajacaliforniensis TaxID=148 RepID=UPI00036E275E|nr:hypothetical protein [Sediminispirochaeta bajacaliforniensis]